MPVVEHHDGFSMYDNSYTKSDPVEMDPKRDVIAELNQASERAGISWRVPEGITHLSLNIGDLLGRQNQYALHTSERLNFLRFQAH